MPKSFLAPGRPAYAELMPQPHRPALGQEAGERTLSLPSPAANASKTQPNSAKTRRVVVFDMA
ncbi:hypothetical protein [Chitinimonas sp.]|uniref:hypothetical protein n=1 Tax=Chitinimonas sp. TaxID=1934313 RepID=UPI002F93E4E0